MKRFVIGDIHGAYKALQQVIKKSSIDYKDQLICLGDVCDGWTEVPECFNELLKFKNLIYVMGNHDQWTLNWFNDGSMPDIWTSQGGKNTIKAYRRIDNFEMEKKHQNLLINARPYYLSDDNKLFVHGGFSPHVPINKQALYNLIWDRDLFYSYRVFPFVDDQYNEIFIGHTTTSYYQEDLTPFHIRNLWNLDQGAGWEGKLTLMNVDTKEYFQSDIVSTLYPNEKGRR